MRKILLVIVMICISVVCFAEKDQNAGSTISTTQIQKEYEFLKEQQKEQLSYIKEENKKHRDFIESERKQYETFLAGLAIIISGLFSFWGFKTRSDVKKISNEQVEKFQKEFKKLEDENLIKINRFNQSVEDKLSLAIKQIDSEISYKLARLLNEDKDVIYSIISSYNEESELKKNRKILILGKDKNKNEWLVDLLKKTYSFQYVENTAEDSLFEQNELKNNNAFERYDLIFINNFDDNATTERGINIILKNNDARKVYFVFSMFLKCEFKTNVSSATMKSQIYGNIMNLLKYQSIVNKS